MSSSGVQFCLSHGNASLTSALSYEVLEAAIERASDVCSGDECGDDEQKSDNEHHAGDVASQIDEHH